MRLSAIVFAALAAAGCQQDAAQPVAGNAERTSVAEAPLAKTAADPNLQWGACPDVFPAGCQIAVLHGDPSKPNADVFLRVPAGYSIPPHSHSSPERMILVTGALRVQYQGHPETMLRAGSYAFGPAKLPHEGTCAAGEACTLFIAFEGPVDVEPFTGTIE